MLAALLRIFRVPAIKALVVIFCLAFSLPSVTFAQAITYANLPPAGRILKSAPAMLYPVLTGVRFNPDDPLNLTFLADSGSEKKIEPKVAERLIRYFLAGLTVPEDELWVNLSPYEKERIAPDDLAVTDLGRDMLAQDYVLKQLAASLTYPENKDGKDYWSDIYEGLYKQFGNDRMAVNSFNKVWITPGKTKIYETDSAAFIAKADLQVLTEFDYDAFLRNSDEAANPSTALAVKALRERVVPAISEEVNHGANFSQLRQIYRSLILAVWFKQKFKESFYKSYINQAKVKGIDLAEKNSREKIFNLYVKAFKKGAYNYVKGENDPHSKKRLRRRYYSGGMDMQALAPNVRAATVPAPVKLLAQPVPKNIDEIKVRLEAAGYTNELMQELSTKTAFSRDEQLRALHIMGLTHDPDKGTQISLDDALRIARVEAAAVNKYQLTPHLKAWLAKASPEELTRALSDTAVFHNRNILRDAMAMGSPITPRPTTQFEAYLWLRTLMELRKRVADKPELLKALDKKYVRAPTDIDQGSATIASTKAMLKQNGFSPAVLLPADIGEDGKYQVFNGGLGMVLLLDDGTFIKLTIPSEGSGTYYVDAYTNELAIREAKYVQRLNKNGIADVPVVLSLPHEARASDLPQSGIIPPAVEVNGALAIVYKSAPKLKSLENSEYVKGLHGHARILYMLNALIKSVEALRAAHKINIVHRDFKPANIGADAGDQANLLDWGLAGDIGQPVGPKLAGSLDYAAPEAYPRDTTAETIKNLTRVILRESDYYSVGATINVLFGKLVHDIAKNALMHNPVDNNAWLDGDQDLMQRAKAIIVSTVQEATKFAPKERIGLETVLANLRAVQAMVERANPRGGPSSPVPNDGALAEGDDYEQIEYHQRDATIAPSGVVDAHALRAEERKAAAKKADPKRGGIDFNYSRFNIKPTTTKSDAYSYADAVYDGITLKSALAQPLSPNTTLAGWAGQK